MRLLELEEQPFDVIRYLNAGPRGRVEAVSLPLLRAKVAALPDGLDAVVAASDLQGRAVESGGERPGELLGIALAQDLAARAEVGLLPPANRIGVVLAGDLYTVEDLGKRGGLGDVDAVFRAFAERFAWVAGVLGNHDRLEEPGSLGERCHVLDVESRLLGGVRIGGVSGIVGASTKPGRREEDEFLASIEKVVAAGSNVVLLHEGPDAPGRDGNPRVRELLEWPRTARRGCRLVVCGHTHWDEPLAELSNGVQLLNVDARVVVMMR